MANLNPFVNKREKIMCVFDVGLYECLAAVYMSVFDVVGLYECLDAVYMSVFDIVGLYECV